MHVFLGLACLFACALSCNAVQPHHLLVIRDTGTQQCKHLAIKELPQYRGLSSNGMIKSRILPTGEEQVQYIHHDRHVLWQYAETMCGDRDAWPSRVLDDHPFEATTGQTVLQCGHTSPLEGADVPPLEVEPLIISGPSGNRVDLVFFADGYTAQERDKFFDDALRLANDISRNQTFYTVQPLLNFWAAFTPSKQSGVGTGGKAKDTPFGLYRDGTELRGVYYSKPEVAREACFSLGHQCDYPILMGNDPLYGGLGGEFTVITPSLANGALVLRHELGHSIIEVGEEYDGGFAYFGVNAAHSVKPSQIPWAHWLTHAPKPRTHQPHVHIDEHPSVRVERSVMPMQAYPWTLLNASRPWSTRFNSSGTYAWHLVRFSLSGLPEKGDLRVELDGKDLGWVPHADIGVDRWHYDVKLNKTLKGGEHEVKFTLRNEAREGVAQLCSVEVLEFGDEDEFVATPGHYSLYPTFSEKNETSYRPTNEDCLMRIVTTPNFCRSCTEGLWHALLRRVDLIDDLRPGCALDAASGARVRTLDLELVPLAHLRDHPVGVEESYAITWLKDGTVLEEYANRTRVMDEGDAVGNYVVQVRYATEEVRKDRDGLLASTASVFVGTRCEL
ncbi:IgA peptidase M64-domain-containing protein [Trametes polyzona]|nr:IgA peptidase M64-domain-containing protein [Trametes polyzona]